MNLALVQYTSIEVEKETEFITLFSNELKTHFEYKKYGNDLFEIIIGVICVSSKFESFFKPRKPKFTKEKKHIHSEGFEYEIEKLLEYSIKLDFVTFKNGNEEENKKLLATEIINSLQILDSMKKKIKDFDAERFKADLKVFFVEKQLL